MTSTSKLLSSLALLLAVSACEPDDEVQGSLRARFGESWKEFDEGRSYTFIADGPPTLYLCGDNDPLPNAIDDETGLCITLVLDASVSGSGPATFTIDGAGTVPYPDTYGNRTFAAGPAHSAGVTGVWATTSCFAAPSEEDAVQQLSGRLELEENSATKYRGRLVLNVTGPLGTRCPGDAAEADLEFEIQH